MPACKHDKLIVQPGDPHGYIRCKKCGFLLHGSSVAFMAHERALILEHKVKALEKRVGKLEAKGKGKAT